jgi:hypothetical protein
MCVCVCVCAHACGCVHVCACAGACVHISVCVCICVCVWQGLRLEEGCVGVVSSLLQAVIKAFIGPQTESHTCDLGLVITESSVPLLKVSLQSQ